MNANPNKKSEILKIVNSTKEQFSSTGGILDSSGKVVTKVKNLTPNELKSIWDSSSDGFTAAGKMGNSLEDGFHRTLRDVVRKELDYVAPGFEKATGVLKSGIEREKNLKTVRTGLERKDVREGLKSPVVEFSKSVGKTAASGAAIIALYKLLGFGGGSGNESGQ